MSISQDALLVLLPLYVLDLGLSPAFAALVIGIRGIGILVFDVTSAPADFATEEAELVSKFLAVTAKANEMWNSGENNAEMLPVIAKDAGMDEDATMATISTFTFPTVEEQLNAKWLGGGAQSFMGGVANVFVEAGSIPSALDSYAATVNTGPLESAAGM